MRDLAVGVPDVADRGGQSAGQAITDGDRGLGDDTAWLGAIAARAIQNAPIQLGRRRVLQQVAQQMQNGALSPLKTEASYGIVPVDDWVLDEVSTHMQRYAAGPDQLIVTNAEGRPVSRSAFRAIWRSAVATARTCGKPPPEVAAEPECRESCAEPAHMPDPGTRFHDLRHFYASALIHANLNPKVVQARPRHATNTETMDTYSHLLPSAEDLGRGRDRGCARFCSA